MRFAQDVIVRTVLAVFLVASASCGSDSDPAGPEPAVPAVSSVTVTPNESTLTWLGETAELSATARDGSGNVLPGKSVSWSSSAESVAVVDDSGAVTAVGNGAATIRATVEGVTGEASLTILQVLTSLALSQEVVTFDAVGDTVRVLPEGADEGGSPVEGLSVEWSSEDTDVAEIDAEGLVTAVGEGSTSIVAAIDGMEAEMAVSVEQVMVGVAIRAERDSLTFLGDSVRLRAEGRDRLDRTIPGVKAGWTSDDPAVATISPEGWLRAVGNGTVRVEAVLDEFEAETLVVVLQLGTALGLAVQPGDAAAGQPLGTSPEVEVLDAGGSRVAVDSETEVNVSIASGGGELEGTLAVQVEDGKAAFVDLALGGKVGERTLTFEAPGLEALVSEPFMLGPGLPAALVALGGDGQTALADTELPDPLAVVLRDAWENAVPGVEVSWSVSSGGGSLSKELTGTDEEGGAAVAYTMGRHAGEEVVEAEAAGLDDDPVAFTLTATPNGTISGVVSLSSAHLMAASTDPTAIAGWFGASGQGTTTSSFGGGHDPLPGAPRRPASGSRGPPSLSGMDSFREPPSSGRGGRSQGPEFAPGELIVILRREAVDAPSFRARVHAGAAEAGRVADRIRAVLGPVGRMEEGAAPSAEGFSVAGVSPIPLAARVRLDDPGAAEAVAHRLRGDPRVAAVERNRILHRRAAAGSRLPASASDPPVNDPLYPHQAWHYAMIDLPEAWEMTTGSSSVIVAVIDDGIRFDHPDIAGNLRGDGYDFVANDWTYDHCSGGSIERSGDGGGYDPDPTIPYAYHWDGQCLTGLRTAGGHGLHVAGTIGAVGNDGLGGTGVSPIASIRPVRVLDITGSGTDYDVAQGILYSAGLPADDGKGGTVSPSTPAHVINLSLGAAFDFPVMGPAVTAAWEAGSLIVASAGNLGNTTPNYPAAYPEAISVSAVNPFGNLATYSSHGPTIELAAPGGQTQFGCDFGVISTTWNFQTGQPGWHCHQGTSMAAPHVSGVAALIFAQEPGLSAAQVRARLRDWAVDLGDPDLYGHGLVNARNSLTRSFEPAGDVHAVLLDAGSGEELARAPAAPDGSFEFRKLDDADHLVFAGRDRGGDALVGVPGRRWGGFGGTADPGILTVDGAATYPASFTIGFPLEAEPNNDFAEANRLVLGGYVRGIIDDSNDVDVFRVSIPEAGTYTFETSAVRGACGFALEEDTVLQLYDGSGTLLSEEDAIDPKALNFCSRITHPLEPGDHFLAVWGRVGDRRYQLQARAAG